MKKLFLLVLVAFCFLFSLTGCSSKVRGEWELVAIEADGKRMTISEFICYLEPDEVWDDGELDDEIDGFIDEFKLEFEKDERGRFAGERFEWEKDGKYVEMDFIDDDIDELEAVIENDELSLEIDFGREDIILIYKKK